jgi:hypothetical protein
MRSGSRGHDAEVDAVRPETSVFPSNLPAGRAVRAPLGPSSLTCLFDPVDGGDTFFRNVG